MDLADVTKVTWYTVGTKNYSAVGQNNLFDKFLQKMEDGAKIEIIEWFKECRQ